MEQGPDRRVEVTLTNFLPQKTRAGAESIFEKMKEGRDSTQREGGSMVC